MKTPADVAAEWQQFVARSAPQDLRPIIVESWVRSEEAGVQRDPSALVPPRLDDAQLLARCEAAGRFLSVAARHLQWLSGHLANKTHVAYLTDADGIVLRSCGDLAMRRDFGLDPGYDWSEKVMGTNGAGTALATGQPVAVIGAEHYVAAFGDCTCTAAPIRLDGRIVGALDVSSAAADATPDRLILVAHIAAVIEHELQHAEAISRDSEYRQHIAQLRAAQSDLNSSNDLFKLAVQRRDEFVATLGHELRNPLATIRNGLHIIERANRDSEHIARATQMMKRQLTQVQRLLDDLSDLERISRGKVELRLARLDLADALKRAIESSQVLIESKSHELLVRIGEVPLHIQGDRERLVQAFANLLGNAAKYTEKAGRIWLTLEQRAGFALVTVKDTGIGIAADVLPEIFGMFYQARRAASKESGLGIGLALAKQIVELHGGSIEAHSPGVGQGSEFKVSLPLMASG